MKIGFCANADRLEEVKEAGFDYIELPVNPIAALSGAEFEALRERTAASGLPCPSFNLLFPGSMELYSPECTDEKVLSYLDRAFARVSALGGRLAVFGSGRSRTRPEGISYDAAFERLRQVCVLCGEAGERHDVTVVIEPLNRGECNMINSVAEGACLRVAAGHPRVKLLADYYHIALEHEPPEDLERLGGIAHCHIAYPEGRRVPLEAHGEYGKLFSAMKRTGYAGLVSVEGRSDDLRREGPLSVGMLKRMWEEA